MHLVAYITPGKLGLPTCWAQHSTSLHAMQLKKVTHLQQLLPLRLGQALQLLGVHRDAHSIARRPAPLPGHMTLVTPCKTAARQSVQCACK